MRNIFIATLSLVIFFGFFVESASAIPGGSCGNGIQGTVVTDTWVTAKEADGYTCTTGKYQLVCSHDTNRYTCTKITGYTYSATVDGAYTLCGVKTAITTDAAASVQTPTLYLINPPDGPISISINSPLNSYFPVPSFNRTNGWNVIGDKQKGTVSIDGKDQKSLFYELAMNSVTLNRHGQNFSSKEEITSFLQNSDFFDKLGFSTKQKENSLNYVLQKLNNSKVSSKYYYLTILTDESVADISTLAIQPKPKKVLRDYFAIYTTDVPVKIGGSFVFPKKQNVNNKDFIVEETGELMIPNTMMVFFR